MFMKTRARARLSVSAIVLLLAGTAPVAQSAHYFPPAGTWAKKAPAELGLDPVKLAEAVSYAQSRESNRAIDFSDQEKIFGSLLGSMPTRRAATNGLVIYKGFVVAEFGDTTWVDPTYSVAKSMMSSVAAIAVRDGRIAESRPAGRRDHQGRRLRLAPQRPDHLEDAPAAGVRVGRQHVGQGA